MRPKGVCYGYSAEEDMRINQLRAEGKSWRDVCRALGRGTGTSVLAHAKTAKLACMIPAPPPPKAPLTPEQIRAKAGPDPLPAGHPIALAALAQGAWA